jgi:hypothetical protein
LKDRQRCRHTRPSPARRITPDGKGTGTLLSACQIKVNKQGEISIEANQNPWKLSNIQVSGGK